MTAVAFPKPTPRVKERSPWRRSKPIRSRRPRRLDRPGANPDHLHRLHGQLCEVRRVLIRPGYYRILTPRQANCRGRIEACHEGEKKPGVGLKSSDSKAIAMCKSHHCEWTNPHRGHFSTWTPEERRAWASERGAESEARYLSHGSRRAV